MQSGSGLINPIDFVWHHNDALKELWLLKKDVHTDPGLQGILHPGPNRSGGFAKFYGSEK
jgi:hypothetical protein